MKLYGRNGARAERRGFARRWSVLVSIRIVLVKSSDFVQETQPVWESKPSRDIYLETAKRLGVLPEQCLFMDDSKENVEGAVSCGMQTIWWGNKEEGFVALREFLAERF